MPVSPVLMLGLFAVTLFISATLLFLVQPMIGKMMLPHLGGTPAVWNTCMVFFQAVLLAGYAYAHATTTWLNLKARIILHCVVLFIPVVVFPIAVAETWAPAGDANPIPSVLGLLFVTAGLPFFVISTTAPLLQKWFSTTTHPAARDPYFLYGASNLGSMLALLGYPILVEPFFKVDSQSLYWSIGFVLLGILAVCCGALVWMSPRAETVTEPERKPGKPEKEGTSFRSGSTDITRTKPAGKKAAKVERDSLVVETSPSPLEKLHWVALAFVPSSLLLGATTYITTDVAAIPFLWIPPLALYLMTFILVFTKMPRMFDNLFTAVTHLVIGLFAGIKFILPWLLGVLLGMEWEPTWGQVGIGVVGGTGLGLYLGWAWLKNQEPLLHRAMILELPLLILLLIFIMMSNLGKLPMWGKIGIHLVVLFVAAMVCHGELARRRPATKHLTEFFLLMSVGGVLGGVFNALIAPVVFNSIVEYPLAMVLALLLLPRSPDEDKSADAMFKDFGYPAALGVLSLVLISGFLLFQLKLGELAYYFPKNSEWLAEFLAKRKEQIEGSFNKIVRFGIPVVICYTFVDRPLRLALGVGAILLAYHFITYQDEDILKQERSFFGVLKVERDGLYHKLMHGTTLHGTQKQDWDRRSATIAIKNQVAGVGLACTNPYESATYFLAVETAYWEGKEAEWLNPKREALTYYHRTGPIGQVMQAYRGSPLKDHIAVIGLGTGTMSTYCEPGKKLTFYDIDKHVRDIASNDKYFSYLIDARARGADIPPVVLGDARVELKRAVKDSENPRHNDRYGIMVIDAFSSDAIPIHLMTLEAIRDVYLPMLADHGIIAFHISNRHLELGPVLGNLARAIVPDNGKEPLVAIVQHDGKEEAHPGKAASTWVLLARSMDDFALLDHELRDEYQPFKTEWTSDDIRRKRASDTPLGFVEGMYLRALAASQPRWDIQPTDNKVGVWTDDYSNLLRVFNWR